MKFLTYKRITLLTAIFYIALFAFPVIQAADPIPADTTAYSSTIEVTVQPDSSAGDWGDLRWVGFGLNTGQLATGDFLQTDADDVLSRIGANFVEAFVHGNEDSSFAWVLPEATFPQDALGTINLHIGAPTATRDQAIGFQSSSDTVDIPDTASLDLTSTLTIDVASVVIDKVGSEFYILQKPGAYGIGVDATGAAFGEVRNSANTSEENIIPRGTGLSTAISFDLGGVCTPSTHWDCVDTSPGSVGESGGPSGPNRDYYKLSTTTLDGSIPIDHVEITSISNGVTCCKTLTHGLRLGASETTVTHAGWVGPNTWTDTISRPGGGSWTMADLVGLQAILELSQTSTGSVTVSEIDVIAFYQGTHRVTGGAVPESIATSVKLTYDQATLALQVDGSTVATDTQTFAINTTTTDVVLSSGTVDGFHLHRARIGGTSIPAPTYVLDLDFEPEDVSQTQEGNAGNSWNFLGTVEDLSASNNDATYTFVRDLSGLNAVVGSLFITSSLQVLSFEQVLLDVVGDITSTLGGLGSNASSLLPFEGIINEAADVAGLDRAAIWLLIMTGMATGFAALTMRFLKLPVMALIVAGFIYLLGALMDLYAPWIIVVQFVGMAGMYAIFRMNRTAQI